MSISDRREQRRSGCAFSISRLTRRRGLQSAGSKRAGRWRASLDHRCRRRPRVPQRGLRAPLRSARHRDRLATARSAVLRRDRRAGDRHADAARSQPAWHDIVDSQGSGQIRQRQGGCLTLSELERWFAQRYHNSRHAELDGTTPLGRCEADLAARTTNGHALAQPRDHRAYFIDFLPVIRRGPRDLSRIFVLDQRQDAYLEVPCRNLSSQHLALGASRRAAALARRRLSGHRRPFSRRWKTCVRSKTRQSS